MNERVSVKFSLRNYALLGLAAAFILGLIEWIDLNVRLTPVFQSFSERLVFTSYFSLSLLVGSLIGLLVGAFAYAFSFLKRWTQTALAETGRGERAQEVVATLIVSALAGLLLSKEPHVHGYIVGLIIEGQKLPYVYGKLLPYEKLLSYAIATGLVIASAIIWWVGRRAGAMPPLLRRLWLLGMAALMSVAYYVDSRYEVQLYEYTLHRTMFLAAMAAALVLVASLYASSRRIQSFLTGQQSPRMKVAKISLAVALLAAVAFTFAHFGKNQNLKDQVMNWSTQAKQHFKLTQWALDFDRDGYSPYLGGGDADDGRADINPEQAEILADGLDNNCVGGDLNQDEVVDWKTSRSALNNRTYADARRLNIVYIFIDALRADHLSLYGYNRATSPNFDRLAARSVVFENAYSPSANTFESAARFMKSSYWDAPVESWTETLARNNYYTALFPQRRLSMLRRYVKGMQVAPGAEGKGLKESVDLAIKSFSDFPKDRPFCAYIYAVEPHRPYAKHGEFYYGESNTDLYDGEIAYTDFHLGRLFDSMEQNGRFKDTMIILMADHAESLGERGVYRHSAQLYNDQTHVPMIFYMPDCQPRRVSDYVSTIDLGSTILNGVGLNCPAEYVGVSLLPLMRGEPFIHPTIFGEQTLREKEFPNIRPDQYPQPENKKYMAITQDGYKLIFNRGSFTFQLFDLRSDPQELRNLYDYEPEKAEELKGQLGRFIDIVRVSRPAGADESKYFFGDERANDESAGEDE
ncbi:MAG TPA: sulfatase-like hydrolase/transferase [Blastocatellia bacterium]|nr:sulfatase-like hydrolase/transferase [Blastocatellia bacterium]